MTPADVAAALTKYNVGYATAAEITAGLESAKAIAPDQLAASGIYKETNRLCNVGIAATVSSKALTIALKGENGNDPSASNIVSMAFRDETLTTGTPNVRNVTGALSVVLSSGSALGFTAAETGRLYVWAIDNAGTVELALSRTAVFPEENLVSTTAEGGAGAADSASIMYSATARTNVACRCLGYIEITTGATAGEWDNAPTKIQIMGPGIKRTGDIVQTVIYQTGASAAGTTRIPQDDTIPQITEGNEYMTLAITPTSAINKLLIDVVFCSSVVVVQAVIVALFKDAVTDAIAAVANNNPVVNYTEVTMLRHSMLAGGTVPATYRVRAGTNATETLYFNSCNVARIMGGVSASSITITEVMA
jgi:hypothetical protein